MQHGFIQHGVFFINPAVFCTMLHQIMKLNEIMPTVEDAHVDDGAEDVQPAAAR